MGPDIRAVLEEWAGVTVELAVMAAPDTAAAGVVMADQVVLAVRAPTLVSGLMSAHLRITSTTTPVVSAALVETAATGATPTETMGRSAQGIQPVKAVPAPKRTAPTAKLAAMASTDDSEHAEVASLIVV